MRKKAKTIITTDGEVDDMNSFIRCLLYSNEFDILGIILTSSIYHYAGDTSHPPYRWTGEQWLGDIVHLYEKVYPNLCLHASNYPSPEHLLNITKIGNISYPGEMEKITEGSTWIENILLEEDEEPIYIQTWGGTNTTARALKSIQEKYEHTPSWPAIQAHIYKKTIIYIILDQDETFKNYIQKEWPNLTIINDRFSFWHFAYAYKTHHPALNEKLTASWFKENIRFNHGPLLAHYALMGDGNYLEGELVEEQRGSDSYLALHPEYERYDFISEGDSPSFFYLIDNGLRSREHPSYGGWGGRFIETKAHLYQNEAYDYNPYTQQFEVEYALERWFNDLQDDFACRADWCIADKFEKANHPPKLEILEGLDHIVKANQTLTFHALGSDPDGDSLNYHWWIYEEASSYFHHQPSNITKVEIEGLTFSQTYAGELSNLSLLSHQDTSTITIRIPQNAKPNDTIHLICEVSDGKVKSYQRLILTVI